MDEHSCKELPFSGGKYWLNLFGEILEQGKVIQPEIKDGRKFVKLQWIRGDEYYDVAVIVLIITLNIGIPRDHWDKIVPIFDDGNQLNTFPSNISYRYCEPIEILGYPGFFYIPYHSRYGISRTGQMVILSTGKIKLWCITKGGGKKNVTGGYFMGRGIRDVGNTGSCSRHRLVAMTFCKYEKNPWKLVTNHKDGVPGHDTIENLELITMAQNNKHAIDSGLTPNSVIKIIRKNLRTGMETSFPSIVAAAASSSLSDTTVYRRATIIPHVQFDDGLLFKIDDGRPWSEIMVTKKSPFVRQVLARNIFTGEITIFRDAQQTSDEIGGSHANVLIHCRSYKIIPTRGYNFRFNEPGIVWPQHSEKHLRIYKKYPIETADGVLITDKVGNEVAFYESVKDAAIKYRKSIGMIAAYCKGGYTPDGNIFSYYKLTENLGPPTE